MLNFDEQSHAFYCPLYNYTLQSGIRKISYWKTMSCSIEKQDRKNPLYLHNDTSYVWNWIWSGKIKQIELRAQTDTLKNRGLSNFDNVSCASCCPLYNSRTYNNYIKQITKHYKKNLLKKIWAAVLLRNEIGRFLGIYTMTQAMFEIGFDQKKLTNNIKSTNWYP